ncbi:hypothetical protein BDR06DRAFT_895652 [Suillus hirtellus]|nr:hypothetical protein BDR06DRAFT_895652 [Suillus hirtellus]
MQAANSISIILHALQANQLSVAGFVQGLLSSKEPYHHIGRESLLRNAGNICSLFYHQESHESVLKWAIGTATKIMCREITDLSHELHFKASTAMVEQLEGQFMEMMATKMCTVTLLLWGLISALLNSNQDHQRAMIYSDGMTSSLGSEVEMDLGEFGSEAMDGKSGGNTKMKTKKHVHAAERNAALISIVSLQLKYEN